MKLSMTFKIDVYDFDAGKGETLLSTPGDYIRTRRWLDENMPEVDGDDAVSNILGNLVTAWHVLQRSKKLGDYGLPSKLTPKAVEGMADRLSVYVEYCSSTEGDDAPPLPGGQG